MFESQVSNQCMALAKDSILVPTKDAPELAYVIESTEEKYVPDVFFMEMDEYKNEIKKIGRPLPVEYLLLDVTVTAPIEPLATFSVLAGERKPFAVENRLLDSSLQVTPTPQLTDHIFTMDISGFQLVCSVHVPVQVCRVPHRRIRHPRPCLLSHPGHHAPQVREYQPIQLSTMNLTSRDFLGPLYEAIRTKNEGAAREWSYLDHWSNMQALIQASTMN